MLDRSDPIWGPGSPIGLPQAPSFSGLLCETSAWDEAEIPARDWIARSYLLRRSISLVIGPGGVSKSTLCVAYAVGLALGMPINGMHPCRPFRVMIMNAEDDQDEQRRRLSAVLTSLGRTPDDIAGLIARVTPNGVGTLLERNTDFDVSGSVRPTAAMLALINAILSFKPDVLILDPLAELHGVDENDNIAMREVVALFRRLAVDHDLALVLVHHTRKGPSLPADMDTARGASSIVSASRIVLTVTGMDEAAAQRLGVAAHRRRHYFRVDGAKNNYAELSDAEWFERAVYTVGAVDTVAVPVPWAPPNEVISLNTYLSIACAVEQGSSVGPWSAKLSSDVRSVRNLFEQHDIRTLKAQRDCLADLLARGFVETPFRRSNRGTAFGLRSADGRPDSVTWIEKHSA